MSNYIGKSLPGFSIVTTGSGIVPKRKRRSAGNRTYKFPIDESVETMLLCFNSDITNDGRGVVLKDPIGKYNDILFTPKKAGEYQVKCLFSFPIHWSSYIYHCCSVILRPILAVTKCILVVY